MASLVKRGSQRPIAVAVAIVSTVAGLTLSVEPSRASSIGGLSVSPSTGVDSNAMTVVTPGPCLGGTNFQVFLTGAGFPAAGYPVTTGTPLVGLTATASGGYSVPLLDTMQNFALAQSPPATLAGTYKFAGRCTNASGTTTFTTYDGSVDFTQNAGGAPTYVTQVQVAFGYFTATALSASPGGPVNAGATVTFTSHVATSPVGGAFGTVQLMDGATAIGSPATVDGSGDAVVSTSFAAAGDHAVTATFTGKFAFITDSVSPPLILTVNGSPAAATSTALAISPASADTTDTVTLTASVADVPNPAVHPVGTVQFEDAGQPVGVPIATNGTGPVTLSRTFSAGSHSLTASFIPTDSLAFGPSASTSQTYVVAQAGPGQTIETAVDPGALTISVEDSRPVVLPSPALNATATFLTTLGTIHPVTVTDTRAGNPGWVVSGQVSDFLNTASPTTPINGYNLGWTPTVLGSDPGQTIVAGPRISPAGPPVWADLAAGDAHGLKAPRTLGSAAAGAGTGTAHLGATLNLNVPTTVVAGSYEATLTLTAI